ncbi:hypothetical protein NZ698_05285 [Chryseobacterium sp. PBS4-4]|uniref:cGAS/DncV-like nucleotidyltransferase C-terminal helical domain-containing protein n=1 Tax=Chryseobacterium edaphi TaxID=2976532 RepID=A0ABT2W301_9FLAO|nr:hypothetical protein [Chryseobacterium edaphi]MCU7616602.1 hypothetical protein [Chryseobacterium edaphi]
MPKNYTQRLEKLQKRRYDDYLEKSILSESFRRTDLGASTKYTLESMKPIDDSYTKNTIKAAENIQNNLKEKLKNEYNLEFRHQGSTITDTHIKIHSDIDILVFTDSFITLENPQIPDNPYSGNPVEDLKILRSKCYEKLNNTYNQVDNSNSKAIKVFPTQPKRKVDVVICNWFNSNAYKQYSNEIYRGIYFLDRDNNKRIKDHPFSHINQLKLKSTSTNKNFNKVVRILKTLKIDADYEIKLSSFEICCLVYDIDNSKLNFPEWSSLLLLNVASEQLGKLILNDYYRENLDSPNNTEKVFPNSNKVVELKKLKLELDELIVDVTKELSYQHKSLNESLNY